MATALPPIEGDKDEVFTMKLTRAELVLLGLLLGVAPATMEHVVGHSLTDTGKREARTLYDRVNHTLGI